MNILIDVNHPAHVHFFRHAVYAWQRRGHQVLISGKDSPVIRELLTAYDLPFATLVPARGSRAGLLLEWTRRELNAHRWIHKFDADVVLSVGGTLVVHATRLAGRPCIVFTDTEIARLTQSVTFPFATAVCTPACFQKRVGKKQVTYAGYQELAYLHPNYFRPDDTVLEDVGLSPEERFAVLRLSSWGSVDDIGQRGFNTRQKLEIVRALAQHIRVLLSAEGELPTDLSEYGFQMDASRMHSLLHFASVYVGEGATMASEAAILGTPSIYINPLPRGYLDEQAEKHDLVLRSMDLDQVKERSVQIVLDPKSKNTWRAKAGAMLAEKIDVTGFVVDLVERIAVR